MGDLLNTRQVAKRYGVRAQTVRRWRVEGQGPKFVRIGGRLIRYRIEDLEAYETRK